MSTRRIGAADAALCLALFVAAGFLLGAGDVARALLAVGLAVAWGWTSTLRRSARLRTAAVRTTATAGDRRHRPA